MYRMQARGLFHKLHLVINRFCYAERSRGTIISISTTLDVTT
jgi:hypothetical protein